VLGRLLQSTSIEELHLETIPQVGGSDSLEILALAQANTWMGLALAREEGAAARTSTLEEDLQRYVRAAAILPRAQAHFFQAVKYVLPKMNSSFVSRFSIEAVRATLGADTGEQNPNVSEWTKLYFIQELACRTPGHPLRPGVEALTVSAARARSTVPLKEAVDASISVYLQYPRLAGDLHEVATKAGHPDLMSEVVAVVLPFQKPSPPSWPSVLARTLRKVTSRRPKLASVFRSSGRPKLASAADATGVQHARASLADLQAEWNQDSIGQLTELNRVVLQLHNNGQYQEALNLGAPALAIARQHLQALHPAIGALVNNVALVHRSRGDYGSAEPLSREAVDLARRSFGEENRNFGTAVANLAYTYRLMGDYKTAEGLYRQALNTFEHARSDMDVAITLTNLGELQRNMGDIGAAQARLELAVAMWRRLDQEVHPFGLSARNNLALVYQEFGGLEAAEGLLRANLWFYFEDQGPRHPHMAMTLHNLAGVYRAMGHYGTAELLYREALDRLRQSTGDGTPEVAGALANLATVCAAAGRSTEALEFATQLIALDDQFINQIFGIASDARRSAYLDTVRAHLDLYLTLAVLSDSATPATRADAFKTVLRRKGIRAEALAEERDAVLGGRYPDLEPQLREIASLRMQIADQTLGTRADLSAPADQERIALLIERKEQLEVDLAHAIPETRLDERLRAASPQTVAQALPDESALVEFIRITPVDLVTLAKRLPYQPGPLLQYQTPDGEYHAIHTSGEVQTRSERYLAFVLLAGQPETVQSFDLGEAEPIDQGITQLKRAIGGMDRHLAVARSQAHEPPNGPLDLRAAVFDPLIAAFNSRRRLIIAPDSDLALLSFGVLPTEKGRYLIDEYEISYLAVGRDVLRWGLGRFGEPGLPLVAADPDYDLSTSEAEEGGAQLAFPRLPGTRTEGEKVAALLGVQPWLAGQVLEGRIKAVRSPRVLHIATHGFFLPQRSDRGAQKAESAPLPDPTLARLEHLSYAKNPLLRSGLALAGANTWLRGGSLPEAAQDGIMHAEDISGLDLLNTDLVVLSACESGLGDVERGEGVFGLRRAFLLAGARTIIVSLWNVPDDQTQQLMIRFYQHLLDGKSRADALRSAQIETRLDSPNARYWGGFICLGDPAPL
jgi:CHAT domain-containing protein/tetratricopeptide (TPR) repeat protein